MYNHTLSLQDIWLFKIVTTQVCTYLLEIPPLKITHEKTITHPHILITSHMNMYCMVKTTVRSLVRRLHVSTHNEQDSVDCKCVLESVGSQGQSLDHMTEYTTHCNGSGM